MSDEYGKYCRHYRNISGSQTVAAATDDTTLQSCRTNYQIYIQRLHVQITAGSAGKTWTFKDSAGTPVNVVPSIDASGIAHFDFDFGPRGIPLTAGKDFLLDVSAAGAAGQISWDGYMRLASVIHTGTATDSN